MIAQEALDDGWWEAIVLARDGDTLTLKWRDYPWQQTFCGTPGRWRCSSLGRSAPTAGISSGRVLRPEHLSPDTNPLIEANHESTTERFARSTMSCAATCPAAMPS